ncbi:hypothetical protein FGO68_gene15502 [Halteria grandinella]|uniref:Uncharacterized protein n=1 Tax=Halteria grandinella TaxID=5974 RepID=A0A8J8NHR9_HALGN|nr:hypothetical protein FGO68_gene15502 [Halteria grandinella]
MNVFQLNICFQWIFWIIDGLVQKLQPNLIIFKCDSAASSFKCNVAINAFQIFLNQMSLEISISLCNFIDDYVFCVWRNEQCDISFVESAIFALFQGLGNTNEQLQPAILQWQVCQENIHFEL